MYCGVTIFVDHSSVRIDVHHQVVLGSSDTIRNKELYEQDDFEVGVEIKNYRGDTGV